MRLSWKLFFLTTPVSVLFLTIFGAWIIQSSFDSSLEKELDRCMVENELFQTSYELSLNSLSKEQREQTTVRRIIESFHKNRGKGAGNARVYSEDGTVLYEDSALRPQTSIRESLTAENNVGSEVVREDGKTYVVVLAKMSNGEFVETSRNISSLFADRDAMYSRYQIGALLLTALVGGMIFLLLFLVMRNMQTLSRATRQFAQGNYSTRVSIRSSDEVGQLAEDFNWMANAMSLQMEQLKDEVHRQEAFSSAFAHELKTPLTSIIGYADTIRQMDLSKEETDMCAGYIYHQGKRLQSLSYKLLEMSMASGQEISKKKIPVSELFQEVSQITAQSLSEKNLILRIQAENGTVLGDRDLLTSVFLNLIDNARKASPEGKTIYLTGENAGGVYTVYVEDEGPGIPPKELPHITEAFYMVDKSRSRREGGAGLGLALCQRIVSLHQASWQFENRPEGGLKVTLRFGPPESGRRERRSRRPRRENPASRHNVLRSRTESAPSGPSESQPPSQTGRRFRKTQKGGRL